MKILRVASDLYPYVVGGIGLHGRLLSDIQTENGHSITFLTCIPEDNAIIKTDSAYPIVDFGRKYSLAGNTFCLNMLPYLFKNRNKFDIIDAHSHLFVSTNLAALVRRFGSAPLIITNHGLRSQAVPKRFQEIYLKTIGRFTFNSADKIITFSEKEKQDMIDIGVKQEKIVIIPNGIDTDKFHPVLNTRSHPFTIIWVGRLSAGKGLKYAILGFEAFLKVVPSAVMNIIGDGPYLDAAREYVNEKGLSEHIILTGRVDNEDMLSWYGRSDVYLMTSMSEGMPRTLLEAMACGLPVVCTDIPQLVPIIETGGIVIPKKNINSVSAALQKLCDDAGFLHTCAVEGRNLIEKEYALREMVRKTEEVYSLVMRDNSSS